MSSTTENNTALEYRLYFYSEGTLRKEGKGKTRLRPHQFADTISAEEHVIFLRDKYRGYKNTQFVIVEWFGPYNSRIYSIV